MLSIVQRASPESAVLRSRAREVPPGADLSALAKRMERTMEQAQGVGLAAPQVGISVRAAMLQLDYKTKKPRNVFVCNPRIEARSDDCQEGYEGCLSISGVGGLVRRNRWIRLRYRDAQGQSQTCEAEGANAVLWQHELDHLDGVLYVDRLLGELMPMEEVRRLRKEAEAKENIGAQAGAWHVEGQIMPALHRPDSFHLARR